MFSLLIHQNVSIISNSLDSFTTIVITNKITKINIMGPMGFEPTADRYPKGDGRFYTLYEPVTLTILSYGPIFPNSLCFRAV